jgi:hypothetical protein
MLLLALSMEKHYENVMAKLLTRLKKEDEPTSSFKSQLFF